MHPEELLKHAQFVKSLARSLVWDEHRAADVAQDVWVAALQHPPVPDRPVQSWFAKVTRNLAYLMHRRDTRRAEREREAAQSGIAPSPEEVLEEEEIRRRLIEAVLELKDPYRSAVLMRYYKGMSARDMADELRVPIETVRTRLKRGIDQLRSRLDATHGSRGAWCLALVPFTGLRPSAVAVAATNSAASAVSSGLAPLLPGVLLMSSKMKIALVAVLLLGSTFALWQLIPDNLDQSMALPEVAVADSVTTLQNETETPGAANEKTALLPSNGKIQGEGDAGSGAEAAEFVLAGHVKDELTGEPVTAFDLEIWDFDENGESQRAVHETVRHESGSFEISLTKGGDYKIMVRSSRHGPSEMRVHIAKDTIEPLLVLLDPGAVYKGRVVDDATGAPVADAIVFSASLIGVNRDAHYNVMHGFDQGYAHARTDADGCFALSGLFESRYIYPAFKGRYRLTAIHPDYAEGVTFCDPKGSAPVEIRLKTGFQIHGKVLNDEGAPVEGLMIGMIGAETPCERTVLTDANGCYTLPPTLPCRVHLTACAPPDRDEADYAFSTEKKWVDVKDRDLEVDFGTAPDQVCWTGTFKDVEGNPVPGGVVEVSPVTTDRSDTHLYNLRQRFECDDQGRFEARKLLPGTYCVRLHWTAMYEWGNITFDEPGNVERDIQVSGGSIRGVVVDADTGQPVRLDGRYGSIMTHSDGAGFGYFTSNLDPYGRFSLEGLPPGSYRLISHIEGYPQNQFSPPFKLGKDEILRDVQVPIKPGGKLKISLAGFENEEQREFRLYMNEEGKQRMYFGSLEIGENGLFEYEVELQTGRWELFLDFVGRWKVDRAFEIFAGETTEVAVHRSELSVFHGDVAVAGTLVDSGGAPLPGARIHFWAYEVQGIAKDDRSRTARTDGEGRFKAEGFKPGRWMVSGSLVDGCDANFPDLIIPVAPADPYPCDLVMPGGVITGELLDKRTGLPFDDEGPMWWVFVNDVETGRAVSELQGGHRGSSFRLIGVPEGEYTVNVKARGYNDAATKRFFFTDGQTRDVGRIELDPCGVLDIEVRDDLTHPLDGFKIFCFNEELKTYFREELAPGKYRYFDLPLGEVVIEVKAEGYKDWKQKVVLEAGRPGEAQAVLVAK
ncbi:MAG: sigma-70 family RNA polymerase sigma factor [Planctomycetota bacterium]